MREQQLSVARRTLPGYPDVIFSKASIEQLSPVSFYEVEMSLRADVAMTWSPCSKK